MATTASNPASPAAKALTHIGVFNGIPPTGKAIRLPRITILRFSGERCVERWSQAGFLGLLKQPGVA